LKGWIGGKRINPAMLTPEEIQVKKAAFDAIFQSREENQYEAKITHEQDPALFLVAADYVGYLAWRAIRSKIRYNRREMNVLRHMRTFRKAECALAALILAMGMDQLRTASPDTLRLIRRFLEMDDL
jgi:hypothetical protein